MLGITWSSGNDLFNSCGFPYLPGSQQYLNKGLRLAQAALDFK
jgi:hypothetical protein